MYIGYAPIQGGNNFMNNSNAFLFQILNLPEDGSIIIDDVNIIDDIKYIHISRAATPTYCPECSCRMHSKGIYVRKVKHPVLQDSTNIVFVIKQRKWKCTNCGAYSNDDFPFIDRYKQSTNQTPLLILNAMRDLNRTTASIAEQFYLSDTQVHDIFTAYVDLPRLPLPEYLSVDEVYINISEEQKYALVLMDFVTGEIVDILHNRWQNTAERYFRSIPREERAKVKCIISDTYESYLSYPEDYFPNATSVLDSFHVSKYLIAMINDYINMVYKRYKARDKETLEQKNHDNNKDHQSMVDSIEVILLRKYRWVLLKNRDEINYSDKRYYHKSLKMYVDTFTVEKMFLNLDPKFRIIRDLKEKYIAFNSTKYQNEDDALKDLIELIKIFKTSDHYIFRKFSKYLDTYKKEIVRSFTTVEVSRRSKRDQEKYYARLSNGPMESFNRKPKDLKRNTRGFSNFHYIRNRILWATRKNPSIRGIPKTHQQVHSFKGKKRGHYKVNKK